MLVFSSYASLSKKKQKQKQPNQNIGNKQARNEVRTQGLKFQYTKRHVKRSILLAKYITKVLLQNSLDLW